MSCKLWLTGCDDLTRSRPGALTDLCPPSVSLARTESARTAASVSEKDSVPSDEEEEEEEEILGSDDDEQEAPSDYKPGEYPTRPDPAGMGFTSALLPIAVLPYVVDCLFLSHPTGLICKCCLR